MGNEGLETSLKEIVEILKTNQLSVPSIITIVIAAAAAIASIVLCLITICSHRRDTKSLRGDVFSGIVKSHRDLFSTIYSNTNFYNEYKKDMHIENDDNADIVAAFYLNHANNLYYLFDKALIDKNVWHYLEIDIIEIFNMESVKNRWETKKSYYPINFTSYINSLQEANNFFNEHKDKNSIKEMRTLAKEGLSKKAYKIFENNCTYYDIKNNSDTTKAANMTQVAVDTAQTNDTKDKE